MNKIKAFSMIFLAFFTAVSAVSAASFLEDEAGISASVTVSNVDLSMAKNAFKAIEKETASYVIGSVAIDGYGEDYDAHVYVDTSGQLVAYYLKSEPASKIVDWINYPGGQMTLEGSKLEDAIAKVCIAMMVSYSNVIYFDFRYPQSDTIKIIIDEKRDGTESFNMNIPSNHIVLSGSWSHAIKDTNTTPGTTTSSNIKIDGVTLNSKTNGSGYWTTYEGEVDSSLIPPDVFHEITVYSNRYGKGYVAIILLYTEIP